MGALLPTQALKNSGTCLPTLFAFDLLFWCRTAVWLRCYLPLPNHALGMSNISHTVAFVLFHCHLWPHPILPQGEGKECRKLFPSQIEACPLPRTVVFKIAIFVVDDDVCRIVAFSPKILSKRLINRTNKVEPPLRLRGGMRRSEDPLPESWAMGTDPRGISGPTSMAWNKWLKLPEPPFSHQWSRVAALSFEGDTQESPQRQGLFSRPPAQNPWHWRGAWGILPAFT